MPTVIKRSGLTLVLGHRVSYLETCGRSDWDCVG